MEEELTYKEKVFLSWLESDLEKTLADRFNFSDSFISQFKTIVSNYNL